jgi:DNA-binding MarR family transcriptional regulator
VTIAPEQDRATLVEEVSEAFKRTTAAVRRLRGRETHRPGGLSFAQYGLLFSLSEHGEMPARELACAAELSPATVTEMLEALASAGLVARVRSERDKRIVLTSLTERGRALVGERRQVWDSRWRAALGEFDEEQLRVAAVVLDRLQQMFDAAADSGPGSGSSTGGSVPGERVG